MTPRRIGFVLCVIGALVVLFFVMAQPEPIYGGKTLSHWVCDLKSSDIEGQRAAVVALRQLDSKPLPHLRKMLRARDTAAKRLAQCWSAKVPFLKIRFISECEQHKVAAEIVGWIGDTNVLPELEALLDHTKCPCAHVSAEALTRLMPAATPPLLKALTNELFEIRWMAAASLSVASGDLVVTNLIAALGEASGVSMAAAVSLGEMRRRPDLVVPALCDYLEADPDTSHRVSAAHAIAKFGVNAHWAVTTLELFRNDTNKVVANAAAQALARIRGDE